jgi:hypothetical protein
MTEQGAELDEKRALRAMRPRVGIFLRRIAAVAALTATGAVGGALLGYGIARLGSDDGLFSGLGGLVVGFFVGPVVGLVLGILVVRGARAK